MRKVDDGEKKKKKEKNGVFSGHYVIASSLPPERLRPNDDRWNAARFQNSSNSSKIDTYDIYDQIPGSRYLLPNVCFWYLISDTTIFYLNHILSNTS